MKALPAGILFLATFISSSVFAQAPLGPEGRVVRVLPEREVKPERHKLIVREPNGSLVQSLRIQKISDKQREAIDLATNQNLQPTAANNGAVELDLSDSNSFHILRSDAGIILLSTPCLLAVDEIQLRTFAQLEVRVRRGGKPAPELPVLIKLTQTSDGAHQLQGLQFTGKTNELGVLKINQLPSSKISVTLDNQVTTRPVGQATITHTSFLAVKEGQLRSGKLTEVVFGEGTRAVKGRLELPADVGPTDLNFFGVQFSYDNNSQHVSGTLQNDGTFTCDDAVPGSAMLQVRGAIMARNSRNANFFNQQLVDIPAGDSVLDLGVIRLSDRRNNLLVPYRSSAKDRSSDDIATGAGPVAWIALVDFGGKVPRELALLNAKGQLVHRPDLGRVWRIECDAARQRFYAIVTFTEDLSEPETLVCADYQGRILWQQRHSSVAQTEAMAVDEKRGCVWILRRRSNDGVPNLSVFNSSGKSLHESRVDMNRIQLAADQSFFWLAGNSGIMKMDVETYRELYVGKIPQPVNRFSLSAAAGNSLYLTEQPYSGRPTETNRLWKFDANGVMVGKIDFGGYRIGDIVDQTQFLLTRCNDGDGNASVIRIKPDLSEYEIIPTSHEILSLLPRVGSKLYCLADRKLAQLSPNEESITLESADAKQAGQIMSAVRAAAE